MLSIGRLSPGAADYYLGEVARSAQSYYLGHGEAASRWVGRWPSVAGLRGQVQEADFRAVLDGRHPGTGERLVSSRGSSGRAVHPKVRVDPRQGTLVGEDLLDVPRVASRLKVTTRRVRQLLSAGERRVVQAGTKPGRRFRPFLVGERCRPVGPGRPGRWMVRRSEVERFEAATGR